MPIVSDPVKIDDEILLSFLGAAPGTCLSPAVKRKIHRLEKQFLPLIEPRLTYRVLGISHVSHGRIRLNNDCQLFGPKLARALATCRAIVCFIATIGSKIEAQIEALGSQKRLADAFVLDAIGSAAIETLVDRFHSNYDAALRKTDRIASYRFSPGYCDWPLKEQVKVFSICDPLSVRVALTPDRLMRPSKSISGIFGIDRSFREPFNPCRTCGKGNCPARRETSLERKIA